jgi:uncharacterized membrane protein
MIATLTVPRLLMPLWRRLPGQGAAAPRQIDVIVDLPAETAAVDPRSLALVIALGAAGLWVSTQIATALGDAGYRVPTVLVVTTLALVLAQIPAVAALPVVRPLAMYAVYLFLAVIGAFCDVRALGEIGSLGMALLIFAAIVVLVHGLVIFGVGRLFRMDLDGVAVASQANIGGSTSALALAKSLGREDLLVPGILLGAVGNAVGTFLAFWAVRLVAG